MGTLNTLIRDGLSFAMPLFIIAIGGIYSERSGITNLALEGLLGAGAFVGALAVVLFTNGAFGGEFYLAVLFAMLGGGVFAMIHGVLCVKFRANQVISGVVINILAAALTAFLTKQINIAHFGQNSDKFNLGTAPTFAIPGLSDIPVIGAIFKNAYVYEPLILVMAVVAWYVLYKTKFGMRLRACGENPHAVDAAGGNVSATRFIAVIISGALSGVGGICFAYYISANFSPTVFMGYGYLSIAALIFGNWRIVPTLGACLLFGFARSGGYAVAKVLEMPGAFTDLFMMLPYIVTLLLLVFFSHTNRAPRALGEIYDKGKR